MDYNFGEEIKEPVKSKPKKQLYTTELINEIRNDMLSGYEVDTTPFFPYNTDLRAPNVVFKMTDEEYEEYERCYNDAIYFIEKYCKFLTDSGRKVVRLRDYQKELLKLYSAQHLDPEIDEMVPDNSRAIIMASRQSAKCLFGETTVCKSDSYEGSTLSTSKHNTFVKIFDDYKTCGSAIHKLRLFIEKIYNFNSRGSEFRYLLKSFLGKCIEYLESIEYKNYEVFDDKFIDSVDIDETVVSDSGSVHASKIYLTKPFDVYEIIFTDGTNIECADTHMFFTEDMREVFAKDLKSGDRLCGKDSTKIVSYVIKYNHKFHMYDMTVDSDEHRYFTNGVLSHNTTSTAAYMTWYVCFHSDRNVGIMANKQDTAIEIVDKTKQMILGLPYFLQPGVESWGKTGCAFDNGCKIISSATTKSASIGYTLNGILYLDEFAHIEPSICDNFWRSVYPTLSSSKTAQLIISSTPNGVDNRFAKIWFGSKNHENSFVNMRVDYWQVPGHDEAWAAQQKKDFGEEFFNQEFLLQFSSSSSSLLRGTDLEFLHKIEKEFKPKHIIKDGMHLDDPNITWHPWFDPNTITADDRFVFLLDTAEGNGDLQQLAKENKKSPDANTIQIFKLVPNSLANMRRFKGNGVSIKDAYRFVQVGKYTRNDQDEEYLAAVCSELAYDVFNALEYDNVRIMLEMNYSGKLVLKGIMNHPKFSEDTIVKTYHTTPIPGETRKIEKKYGFLTTSSKTQVCLRGKDLFARRRVITTDIETNDQLKSFGWVNGKLKGVATHDDLSFPSVHHIARFLDEDSTVAWIEEYFYTRPVDSFIRGVCELMKVYAPEEETLSDEEFRDMYGGLIGGGSGLFDEIGSGPSPYSNSNPFGTDNPFGGFGGSGFPGW